MIAHKLMIWTVNVVNMLIYLPNFTGEKKLFSNIEATRTCPRLHAVTSCSTQKILSIGSTQESRTLGSYKNSPCRAKSVNLTSARENLLKSLNGKS